MLIFSAKFLAQRSILWIVEYCEKFCSVSKCLRGVKMRACVGLYFIGLGEYWLEIVRVQSCVSKVKTTSFISIFIFRFHFFLFLHEKIDKKQGVLKKANFFGEDALRIFHRDFEVVFFRVSVPHYQKKISRDFNIRWQNTFSQACVDVVVFVDNKMLNPAKYQWWRSD